LILTILRIVTARRLQRHRPMRRLAAAALCLFALLPAASLAARGQGIELAGLRVQRQDTGLALDFNVRIQLPKPVDDAVHRGIPLYFVAQATVYRHRWYWSDALIARAARSWRLSYQPLTDSWRVTLAGLGQSYASLSEALAALSSASNWKIADAPQIGNDEQYYVEFSYQLDTSQMPRPMQFGFGGQADWTLGIERTVRVE
jgi:hypothetical protein